MNEPSSNKLVPLLALAAALVIPALLPQSAHGMYDPKHGRWLQRDPAGIRVDAPLGGVRARIQYEDGTDLYEYLRGSPLRGVDPSGTNAKCGVCGLDVTKHLDMLTTAVDALWETIGYFTRRQVCRTVPSLNGWDISELAWGKEQFSAKGCGTEKCAETVQVGGKCYPAHHVNYYLWGLVSRKCGFGRQEALDAVEAYRTVLAALEGCGVDIDDDSDPLRLQINGRKYWTHRGYYKNSDRGKSCPKGLGNCGERGCCDVCNHEYGGQLNAFLAVSNIWESYALQITVTQTDYWFSVK